MNLQKYNQKRDFSKTPEPEASIKSNPGIFVIQKHDSRRLHFDFRIELDGVLKSWAIPKGLSNDPLEKRLAVRTEDHPLDYADFEGTIPKGEYGAGKVQVWDKGKYVNITIKDHQLKDLEDAIEDGHFVIYVKGKKIQGTFGFTKTNGDWIVVRKREPKHVPGHVSLNREKIYFTHLGKMLDSQNSKEDLVAYFLKIAEWMVPHVKNRPITLYRFPDGVDGEKFFQKNRPDYFPDWIHCQDIKGTCYSYISNKAGVVYLGNQVAEIHIMASRKDRETIPDKLLFDFDPFDDDLKKLKKMLKITKEFLEDIGLMPYIMTTGKHGYHIACPIKRELDSKQVRSFALKITKILATHYPEITTELRKENREGKIFIDVNRLSPLQTSIAPYSVRAVETLPIAAPFSWNELVNIDPGFFTVDNYPKEDAWAGFFDAPASLTGIIDHLKMS